METYFEKHIKPDWDEIETARDITRKMLEANGVSPESVDAVIMVTGELIENAIKYGTFSNGQNDIFYSVEISGRIITMEVRNPIGSGEDENLMKLDRMVQWIRGYQNPFEAYIERLQQIAVKPFEDGESGLGLTRIAYEGQSIVDFYAAADNSIAVSAVYHL
ncbi:MAG: ATP-binding protein [Spirochaetae bacterium HGW-Spirochaetae-1]|jgi:hypothetical protein|nr:MAG: ATP-binding protein [Spirochaetae bacterium HGW-Spirochaetae-1]